MIAEHFRRLRKWMCLYKPGQITISLDGFDDLPLGVPELRPFYIMSMKLFDEAEVLLTVIYLMNYVADVVDRYTLLRMYKAFMLLFRNRALLELARDNLRYAVNVDELIDLLLCSTIDFADLLIRPERLATAYIEHELERLLLHEISREEEGQYVA
jgi:hypothetical protein